MIAPLEHIWIVFQKEVTDNLRDWRTLGSGLLYALIGPLVLLILILILGQTLFRARTDESALELPVQGAEYAPGLVQYLRQNNFTIIGAPADAEAAVRNGDAAVVLIVDPAYGEAFRAGQPARLEMVVDTSRQSALAAVERTRAALDAYSRQVGAMRLMARGVSPATISPLALERVDVATPQSQVLIFLNMLPYLLMFTVFSGGSAVIIDATAGERERGSLEPLLINPVARREFVLGKWLAALPFSLITLVVTLIAFGLIFNVVPLEDVLGFQMRIDPATLAGIFLIALPMTVLAAAVQMLVATFARSFKEAQTYVGFLPLVPALPGLGLAFLPVRPEWWTMLIPLFGQQILINRFLRGERVDGDGVLLSAAVTLAVAAVLVIAAVRLYRRESVLFGKR